jgi:transcriptional regulator with XRE-family HTH domain
VSIGETLAEARRQAGLTVTQVSERTRIRESIIRGIEKGDFSACGGDFYARGHIRSIADAVGLDSVPLIKEYDAEHGSPGSISAADVFQPSTPIKLRERRSPSLSMIVIVVLLAIIGYASYKYVDDHGHKSADAASGRGTPSATALGTTPKASLTHSPKPTVAPVPDDVVIQLTAVAECWIELSNSSTGQPIFEGDIYPGSPESWTEKHAVTLSLGNPPGVVLTVNGKRVSTKSPIPVTLKFSPPTS